MGRITSIKYELDGEQCQTHINCNSAGIFSCRVPEKIIEVMDSEKEISGATLDVVERDFKQLLKDYKNRKTEQFLYIGIQYGACGKYMDRTENPEDGSMFGERTKFHISTSFNDFEDTLAFSFDVFVNEVIDGKSNWYIARLGRKFAHFQEQYKEPDKWHRHVRTYDHDHFIMIPYSDQSLESLKKVQETLRKASQKLFEFVSQEPEKIESTLLVNNLLQ